jgi:cyclopropane fatty-acyl-phospholipid synthase-like methyltransferase
MTDRIARRPHGRQARETYGADDAHSFTCESVLEALELGPADRLLDVGCGGGVFIMRHLALEAGFSTARVTRPDESGWAQLLASQP